MAMRGGMGRRGCRATRHRPVEMVRAEGLEPPRRESLEPKSSASTNSATPARLATGQPGRSVLSTPPSRCSKKVERGPYRTGPLKAATAKVMSAQEDKPGCGWAPAARIASAATTRMPTAMRVGAGRIGRTRRVEDRASSARPMPPPPVPTRDGPLPGSSPVDEARRACRPPPCPFFAPQPEGLARSETRHRQRASSPLTLLVTSAPASA